MRNLTFILIVLALWSCKKDEPLPPENVGTYESGIILLNEGLFQQNNSTLSFYSFQEYAHYSAAFFAENSRGLGDTANDMAIYNDGDSTYLIIAVDISSQIEIVNATTFKSVAQIPLFDGANAREPRHVTVAGTRAFTCNFDGTVSVINLNTNTITNTITVGDNPDGLVISGTNLYVTNSGGLNFPLYDSTVSVIDLLTETQTTQYSSRINCTGILADAEGDLYLQSNGNYNDIAPAVLRMNASTGVIEDSLDIAVGSWCFFNDLIYYYDSDEQKIFTLNTLSETISAQPLIDCQSYNTMFGVYATQIGILTVDANSFVNSSTIRAYNFQGDFQYEFTSDINTTDIFVQ